jgi:hypothetical protein
MLNSSNAPHDRIIAVKDVDFACTMKVAPSRSIALQSVTRSKHILGPNEPSGTVAVAISAKFEV